MNTIQQVKRFLAKNRKDWTHISQETGINRWWFPKFIDGKIASPGYEKITALTEYMEKQKAA